MKTIYRAIGKALNWFTCWQNRHPDSNGLYDMDHWLDPVTAWFQSRGMN